MSPCRLIQYKHWIFDMDGTLTVAQHDFEAIRKELGLAKGLPILETLELLPLEESAPLRIRLNAIELEIAHQAKAAEGAIQLLDLLLSQGAKLGVLSRNNAVNIGVTLKAAGLADYFVSEHLLSRDCAPAKPAPAGILGLLELWQAKTDDAVMVGDHLHDLEAGRAAKIATIYLDKTEKYPFKMAADVCIRELTDLLL